MDTVVAASVIARKLRVRRAEVGFAGTKDMMAVTCQRMSVPKDALKTAGGVSAISTEKIEARVLGAGEPLHLGDLAGNRFTITARNITEDPSTARKAILSTAEELASDSSMFPNFFGYQRFGSRRPITHLVGKKIVEGNPKEAVELYIYKTFPKESSRAKEFRKLAKKDPKKAVDSYPGKFFYEKSLISHILEKPGDYAGAIRRLPPTLSMMFVHAYQSYLFNRTLGKMIKAGVRPRQDLKVPLFGFGLRVPKEGPVLDALKSVMREERVDLSAFRINALPELSSKGGRRQAFQKFSDFSVLDVSKEDSTSVTIGFFLPKGCYATVFFREFFDFPMT